MLRLVRRRTRSNARDRRAAPGAGKGRVSMFTEFGLSSTQLVAVAEALAFFALPALLAIGVAVYVAGRMRTRGAGYLWRNLEEIFCALALTAICYLTLAQVIFRYFLNSPLVHTHELSLLAMQWGIYVGAAMAYKHGEVLVIDTAVTALPEAAQRVIFVVIEVGMVAMTGLLAYTGYLITKLDAGYPLVSLPFSQAVFSAAVPVGIGLLLVRCLQRLLELLNPNNPPARRRRPLEL